MTTGPQAPISPLVTPPAAPAISMPATRPCSPPVISEPSRGRRKRIRIRIPTSASSAASTGRSESPSTLVSTNVPISAPIEPGIARRLTILQSTLPNRQCEAPPTTPVTTLAMFTVADTPTGLTPDDSRMLDDVGPKPIPSDPSTKAAANPARPTTMISFMSVIPT